MMLCQEDFSAVMWETATFVSETRQLCFMGGFSLSEQSCKTRDRTVGDCVVRFPAK